MSAAERAGRQFIGGTWDHSTSAAMVPVSNPATNEVIAQVCRGTAEDAHAAVSAAREAFGPWSATSLSERINVVRHAASVLTGQVDDLTRTISREVGTPLPVSRAAQVQRPIEVLTSLCEAAEKVVRWTERIGSTVVVREPLGVVVAITPWNFPLHQAVAKVGAALLAGCTVVLKPSELAPLSAYVLADAFAAAGLPAGALNVVTGAGDVGEVLVSHPDVDGISFTGSTAVGRRIGSTAAETVKHVALELGGKGPSVILPGADVKAASAATAARCFTNSGQVCASLSRLIVPQESLEAAEEALAEFVAGQRLGDPFEDVTTLGPVISAGQKTRISALVSQAVDEGARLVVGGPDAAVPQQGHYVAPTVFSDVTSAMTIAQTEVFGPVLCVMPYEGVDEAVRIANDSEYGLVGAVWGPNTAETTRIAGRMRVGMVGVNGGRINVKAPFGGYRQSGNGREFGALGIEEFLEVKSVNFASESQAIWPAP
ncbi:aldehyde dehydrogenase family protein [Streptomyces odonnellii]|uniref:aldehyde dehydrogenase family protein n=1 Tax=Streptomyces odonnellii TaxID=1417980 RepID=UPI000625E72A|nr:aldehyde dehydrogenase family protein [Streptomyces odonnellii]